MVKTGVAVSGENIEITINKLGKDNHVKYGINVGDNSEELQDTYYNEPITIEKNDVITFQECTNEGECYKQQTLFFDGVNTTKTIDIERPENLFENQEKIESIRKSISEKRVEITVAENNMEAIYEKLDRKNSEKKEIEERLAMVNERIINSFG